MIRLSVQSLHDCSAVVASLNSAFIHNYTHKKNQTNISYPYSRLTSFSHCCSATMVPVEEKQIQRFDVDKAALLVEELRNSYNSRKTQSYEWRMSQIQSIANMIEEKEKDIIEAIHKDLSKPPFETFISEISMTKSSCKLALKELKFWMKPEKAKTPLTTYPSSAEIVSEPLGVVLVISTWNYPFMLSLDPVIGAIAAGNAVVLKPSEIAPATSSLLAKLLKDYVDNSAVRVIEGAVTETSALLEQQWDKIFYTELLGFKISLDPVIGAIAAGGPRVGRIVMAAAAKHLTPVVLELGGKSPAVVDSKINLQVTARRIIAGKWMCTNGQACIGVDYVITTKDFAPKLIDALRNELEEFFGKNPMESKDLSRIVNPFHFTRLASLLDEDRVSDKIVHGGQRDENQLKIAPTILLDVPEDSMVMKEEIFGPLLPIVTVEKIEDSFNLIKSKPKPLAAYVFSDDEQLKDDFVQNISAGAIVFNDTIVHTTVSSLPFGGVGESGMGSYHGKFSFDAFSHKKAVLYRRFDGDATTRYPPYTPEKQRLLKTLLSGNIFRIILALIGWSRD